MNYRITVTRKQAQLILAAVDEYLRLRMGQYEGLADSLAFEGLDYSRKDEHGATRGFDVRIERRNNLEAIFRVAKEIASGAQVERQKPPCWGNCIDLCHVLERQFWLDDPNRPDGLWSREEDEPFQMGDEPLPRIERVDNT